MTFFAQLATLAGQKPERPWLFFRRDLDWRWRSHRQVADHLARCATVIREAGPSAATALPWVSAESLSVVLATLAAGINFEPLDEAAEALPFLTLDKAKWPELLPEGLIRPLITLPAAHGNVDRYQAIALAPGPYGVLRDQGRAWALEELEEQAGRLAALLFAEDAEPRPSKNIVHAGAKLRGPMALSLVMATLGKAVLAFEPYPPATLESVLWCRPTHLLASSDEIAALAAAWTKKNARQSRLRRIVAVGEIDPAWSPALGVPIVALI